jgi:hypothetical protein
MKIDQYIAPLLYRYQCVTVPGFGAFLTEIQSAQFNENFNVFFPPKKLISFNSYLKNNDGLLANHIAQTEKIGYEVAVQNIEKEVAIWKNILQSKQQIELQNIGTLGLNTEGNLVFEASNQVNFLTDSFGLSSFVSPFIKREILELQSNPIEETATIVLNPEIKTTPNYLKYAAIFVLGLGTFGVFGSLANNYYENQVAEQTLIIQKEVQKEVQNKIQEATFFIKSPMSNVKLTIKETEMSYHIVAGAFRNERNAEKIYNRLCKLGYKARRIEKNNFGLFPVLFGSYPSYTEAQKALVEIHENQSPEAWLMIKDL